MAEVLKEIVKPANPMICTLIQKAMGKIGAIGKDDAATNYSGKVMYKFRGIDAVYNALNPVMAELGLFIIPEVLEQSREERQSTNGSTLIYSILKVKFTMYAPDGSSVSGIVIGEGMDSGDKASNKAMSVAMKYFCFQVFCIPTEEMKDPDAEVHEVKPKAAPVVKNVPATTANAPVVVQKKLPGAEEKKSINPVLNYLANEKAFMAEKLGISDAKKMKVWFAEKTKALIDKGEVENVSWDNMNREQAEALVNAIYKTFINEGEGK